MPIKPKYSIGENRPSATRQFTDREEFIRTFQEAIQDDKQKEQRVLMYYGVGGIGKTSLRKELVKLLETTKTNTVSAVLDFEVPSFREQETALFALRKSLKDKFKIKFPTFDLAYAVYWKKTRPQIPMNKETFPLLEDGEIVADMIFIISDAPVIGLIPRVSKMILKGQKVFKDWWTRRGHKELYNLPHMEPKDIAERLPMYWAADLKDYLQSKDLPAVIFIDTYEALWEGARSEARALKQDDWVRELVSQLPEVIWVIFGRERLRWEELNADWSQHLNQYLVGGLSDEDAKRFLESCEIAEESIQKVIVEGSKGVPYYLDLAVDTYYEIKDRHNREPVAVDFAKTPQDVLIRFLRYLDKSEIETLKVLAACRFWNYPLFEKLVSEFKTGYPLTAFAELCRFSFINQGEVADAWTMHQLMREGLHEHLESNILKSVHRFLFNHYNEGLNDLDNKHIGDQQKNGLTEAFYHGKFCFAPSEFFNWFKEKADIFDRAVQWNLLVPLYEEMTKILQIALGQNHPDLAAALINLAILYKNRGKFSEAEQLSQRALAINETAFGSDHPLVASSLNNLAILYGQQSKFSQAETLFRRALAINEKVLGPDHVSVAQLLNNLGLLNYYQSKYSQAEPLLKRALAIREKTFGPGHSDVAQTLNNLSILYVVQGRFTEAEPLTQRALTIFEKAFGPDHPNFAAALLNLANLYRYQKRFSEAEPLLKRALAIREKAFGSEHPNIAQSLNSLANLYREQNKLSEAESLYQRALGISEKAFGPDNPESVPYLNNLANLYQVKGKLSEAVSFYQRVLAIREKSFGPDHPVVAESLHSLGRLYFEQGKFSEAEAFYKRTLAIKEKTLNPDHPDIINLLEEMVELYKRIDKNQEAKVLEERLKAIRAKNQ
jgi:tetratricopeptide (TPR) repeat protein